MKKNLFGIVTESIAVQKNPDFFKALAACFDGLSSDESELDNKTRVRQIETTIKEFTNLTVIFTWHDFGPEISLPDLSNSHIFNTHDIKYTVDKKSDVVKAINKYGTILKGSVDLNTGRVDGVYGECTAELFYPIKFVKLLTPEENAAAILHEVGHYFHSFDFINRSYVTAQVLAAAAEGLRGVNTIPVRKDIIDACSVALMLDGYVDSKSLSTISDSTTIATVIAKGVRQKHQDLMFKDANYNLNAFEALADSFATRHGAGKYLITATDKIYKHYGVNVREKYAASIVKQVVATAFLLVAAYLSTVLAVLIGGLVILAVFFPYDTENDSYKNRIIRIRNDMMEAIKDKRLAKNKLAEYVNELDEVNAMIATVTEHKPWLARVIAFISVSARKHNAQMEEIQELESLLANDLYLSAAKLRLN